MTPTAPHITKDIFAEILQDDTLIRHDDLLIFQTLYSLEKQEASATDLARIIGWENKSFVISKVVGLAKRILKKYQIEQRKREDGTEAFWDFFFTGYHKGNYFIYQLKPELKEALEECGLTDSVKLISRQNAYLFTWNAERYDWSDIEENIVRLQNNEKVIVSWACSSHKRIRAGDRAFVMKVGSEPKGIVASGKVISGAFLSQRWDGADKEQYYVQIELDVLLNPDLDPILGLEQLSKGNLSKQSWTPQASGVSIRPEVVDEIEEEWFEFLRTQKLRYDAFAENSNEVKTFVEGAATQVLQTRYERNVYARRACLQHYGYTCVVCGCNFEKTYGSLGYQFIHVHHLTQVSEIKQEYRVNPIDDLRPVCPNCHAMLHRRTPPLTIEELRELMGKDT